MAESLLFIYLFLAVLGPHCCAHGLSLVAASGGYSSLRCAGFSLRWLLFVAENGPQARGLQCGTRAQQLWLMGCRVQAQLLWCTGLVAPWHVGSSRTRAQTRVPCIGRQILNHCATREVPALFFSVWKPDTIPVQCRSLGKSLLYGSQVSLQ